MTPLAALLLDSTGVWIGFLIMPLVAFVIGIVVGRWK
jgi:hypothetical protein